MKEKYYKKGQKKEGLTQDIKIVLNNEQFKKDLFMSESDYYVFAGSIKKPIIDLNTVLLRTIIDDTSKESKEKSVEQACNEVISIIKDHIRSDLKTRFFEEKLKLYDDLYMHFIKNHLIRVYPEYKRWLHSLVVKYSELKASLKIFNFPEYESLLHLYNDLQSGLETDLINNYCFEDDTVNFIAHSAELLIEKVQDMFAGEVLRQGKKCIKMNRIRKIIYLLKTRLDLDLD